MPPLITLDRIVSIEPGKGAKALRNVPTTLAIFDTHFPRKPVLPGVLIIGSIGELAAALLRSFKQVAVDRSGMQRRRFDLRATLDELLASLRPVYGRHGAEFRNEVPAGILVDGYPGEFGQVISNLVVNAVVHGFDGGAGLVRLRLQQQDAQGVQLLVEDNGCGMSPEVRARAFDPFYSTRPGGSGPVRRTRSDRLIPSSSSIT